MDFCISSFSNNVDPKSHLIFSDIAIPLKHNLESLGYNVELRANEINSGCVNILLGSCLLAKQRYQFPKNTILFNFEQLWIERAIHASNEYIEQLAQYTVWDYSKNNIRYLNSHHAIKAAYIPHGFNPVMQNIKNSLEQEIDVLFCGAINERRKAILEVLLRLNLKVSVLSGCYGVARNPFISCSKLILNIHYYDPASLEVARLGNMWANHKAVVSEYGPSDEMPEGLEQACAYASYDDLIPTVLRLLKDPQQRQEQAVRGFSSFAQIDQKIFLQKALGRKTFAFTS